MKRTIICLGAKRSGTTAIHRVFIKHPEVKICHPNQDISNWEPNFWNYAASMLTDNQTTSTSANTGNELTPQNLFAKQLSMIVPDISVKFPLCEEDIFSIWDSLLEQYGPIVFDKSPKYLGSEQGLQLILKYEAQGRDIRFFGLVRNPRDVIASQYELWHSVFPEGTPQYRDNLWVEYYQRFERFQQTVGPDRCPLIRYEDLAQNPNYWMPLILDHCGLADIPETYEHIRPVSVGRYLKTRNPELLAWKYSSALKSMAQQYGYDVDQKPLGGWLRRKLDITLHQIKQWVKLPSRWLLKSTLKRGTRLLTLPRLEALIRRLVAWRVDTLPPDEALRFLFRLDAAFYPLHGQQAVAYGDGVHTKHRHTRYHDFFIHRIQATERVLDIGCGIGAVAHDVADKTGAKVLGIDLNAENIAKARQQYAHPGVIYQVGDALKDLPPGTFDVIILSNVLEHLPQRANFLRQVQHVTHASRILIRVPLFERDWRVPLKHELGVEWRLDPTHETEYTLESFAEEVSAANLVVVHQEVRWGEIWAELVPNVA